MVSVMLTIGASVLVVGTFICIAAYLDVHSEPARLNLPDSEPVSLMLDEDDIPTEEIVFTVQEDDDTEEISVGYPLD